MAHTAFTSGGMEQLAAVMSYWHTVIISMNFDHIGAVVPKRWFMVPFGLMKSFCGSNGAGHIGP